MNPPLSVLHLFCDWKWTGPAEPTVDLCRALNGRGHRLRFACARAKDGQEQSIERMARERGLEPILDFRLHRGFNVRHCTRDIPAVADFIERERNNILKEYEFGYAPEESVGVVFDGGYLHFLDENMYRPMNAGYGRNEDARDVYREAIAWWQARLDEIDQELVRQ